MNKFLSYTLMSMSSLMLFTGCTTKAKVYPDPDADLKKKIQENSTNNYKGNISSKKITPYQQRVSLLVGSRSNDAKVIVNAGKVLKIYVASYKKNTTLIAAHDIYTYVEKPGFIVGESLPQRNTSGITTPLSKLPYKINASELNILTSDKEISNKDVKNFNNNMYQKRYGYETKKLLFNHNRLNDESLSSKKSKNIENIRDTSILDYIKKTRKNK